MRDYLTLVTSESTGQPYDRVIRELSRNKWMDPKQAIEYGMIDKVGAARWRRPAAWPASTDLVLAAARAGVCPPLVVGPFNLP